MKKLILSAFVLAALASCAKNEVDMSSISTDAATLISFSDINDRITKAANSSADNYELYAWSTAGNETSWFMNVIVGGILGDTYDVETGLIATPYYWPEEQPTITFRAFCPDKVSQGSYASLPSSPADCYLTGGTGTINYNTYDATEDKHKVGFTFNAGLGREDLTLCDAVSAQQTNGSVALEFAHLLSAVTINVALSDAQTALKYAIANSYTAVDSDYFTIGLLMPRKRATFEFGLDSTDAEEYTMDYPKTDDVYDTATPVTYTYTPSTLMYVIPQDLELSAESTSTTSAVPTTVFVNDLVVTFNGAAFYSGTTSINLADALETACGITEFKAGTRYNITIVFDDGAPDIFDNKITFTSTNDLWPTYDITITVTTDLYSETTNTANIDNDGNPIYKAEV